MRVGNQILRTLRIKGFSFLYDEYCYYIARKKIVRDYYLVKQKKDQGSINTNQYFIKLKKLNNYLFTIKLRYAHVISHI